MNNSSKKELKIFIFLIILVGIYYLSGMNKIDNNDDENEIIYDNNEYLEIYPETTIENLPEDYDLIQAIQDKCVISSQGLKVFNKDELDLFLEKVNNNEPYSIKTINYTIEGDMIITNIDFQGDNIFKVCYDNTRDEFSNAVDRRIFYCTFSKIDIEENDNWKRFVLTEKVNGDLNECPITYFKNDAKIINNYSFDLLLNIQKSNKTNSIKITTKELENKYDYNIYYYGIEKATINIDNVEVDLKQALIENKVTMEQIIDQAEKDKDNDVINSDMYKDGGTMIYWYGRYTIIKSNSLDGNKDVYIGIPEMTLNSVR